MCSQSSSIYRVPLLHAKQWAEDSVVSTCREGPCYSIAYVFLDKIGCQLNSYMILYEIATIHATKEHGTKSLCNIGWYLVRTMSKGFSEEVAVELRSEGGIGLTK